MNPSAPYDVYPLEQSPEIQWHLKINIGHIGTDHFERLSSLGGKMYC